MHEKVTVQRLAALGIVLTVFILGACNGKETTTSTPETSDGATLLQERCTPCHGVDVIEREKLTQDQWDQVVNNMVRKGAKLTGDEQQTLVAYLAETYKK